MRLAYPLLLLALYVSIPSDAFAQWQTSVERDEMTGAVQRFAFSPSTGPTERMPFPYNNVQAWIGFGCSGWNEWAYIGFTEQPNLINTKAQNGGYSTFSMRVRWDDQIERVSMKQDWGSRFLHFREPRTAADKMAEAGVALIELNWYGASPIHFRFSLAGSTAAIASVRDACRDEAN